MMPNRILKETIRTSDTIDQLSPEAEVCWYRLLTAVDDFGRMDARPKILRATLFPLRLDTVTEAKMDKWLADMERVGLIAIYQVDKRPYLQVITWEHHQQIRAKRSKFPAPCNHLISDDITCKQMISDDCTCYRNPIQSNPIRIQSESNHVADSIADEAQAEPEPPQFSEESDPHQLASLLRSLILTNNPTARLRTQTPKQFQAWCAEIDRMLRLDQRTPGNVEGVIRWSQADDFWKQNILSPSKLREKYDQLWLRFTANPKTIPRAASPPIDTSPIVEDPEGRAFIDAQIREQEEWDAKHRKRTTTTASTADRRDGDGILSSLSAMQGRGLDGAEADQCGGPDRHQHAGLGNADEVRLQSLARGTNGQDGPPARIHRLAPRG
jgi:hypothetical protein